MTRVVLLFAVALIGCASGARTSEPSSGTPAQQGVPDAKPQQGVPDAKPQQGVPDAKPQQGVPDAKPQQGVPDAKPQQGVPDAKKRCSETYAGDSRYDQCRWRIVSQGYCGGAVPSPEQLIPTPRCMCDGCATDKDCPGSAKGRCAELPSMEPTCDPSARVCVPDGERCPPNDAGQESRLRWRHDDEGHATCTTERGPRP